jgi:hypothetical protein
VDPTIFPRFTPEGNALISMYEAFRFTESYGVIFQCNVKYCLGPCEPVSCYLYLESDFCNFIMIEYISCEKHFKKEPAPGLQIVIL